MKNIICVFIALFCLTNSFSQDQLKDYPGIPIITYRGCVISNSGGTYLTVDDFKYADSSGIFAMQLDNVNAAHFNTFIAPTNLRVMPSEIDITLTDYILTYTEGRYTEFEAEGTPWEDGVTLYSDSLDLYFGNGAVSTKPTTEHGTMIYGPMYRQCRNYVQVGRSDSIPYTASYVLKIDDIDPWLDSSPGDTVCILQVTSTRTWKNCEWVVGLDTFRTPYFSGFEETLVHAETVITYGYLQPSIWDTVHLNYAFGRDVPWLSPINNPYSVASRNGSGIDPMLYEHISQNCVEFKVIWKGKADRVKLSIDKIIVSDQRGRLLKDPIQYQIIKGNIEQQIDALNSITQNRSVGFIGVDEPWSLDQWEPIRIVNEIVDSYRPNNKRFELYYQFNLQAFGRFSWPEDPALGSQVIMIDEFMKRVGKANVWITGWLYDVPCDGFTPDPPCAEFILPRPHCNQQDFRIVNLDHLADSIYKRVVQASEKYPGLFYGMSTQTGRYHAPVREINGREMLYTNNLALLYGSKLLSPWLYFTWDYPWVPGSYTGISNLVAPSTHEITDKYWMLRDTIAPRLNGLMGKTLKKLKPLEQYAGSNGINALVHPENSVPHNYIGFINALGGMDDICFVELGFFEEPQFPDKHYFMPLNRYYSTLLNISFGLINLNDYKNYKITDYVDTKHFTLVSNNGAAEFYESIYPGDAKLYSIAPVIKYGGDLIANETVGEGMTLYDDMVIKNSATLTVAGNYIAKGNIIIENGRIENLDGGRIVFQDGKKLIVNGIATINGTSEEKLTLDFISSNYENGIVIEEGTLHLSYCEIKNASAGVIAQPGSGYISIQHSEFINCSSAGIILLGSSTEGPQAPPPHNSL